MLSLTLMLSLSGLSLGAQPTDAQIERMLAARGVDLANLPTIVVDRDDVEIDRGCTIRIPPGTIIADDEG